jgi:hypothetical protein
LVINPGLLVKYTSGGSYAVMDIHPLKENDLRDAKIAGKSSSLHSVSERASVLIKKI